MRRSARAEIVSADNVFEQDGYFAGTDAQRLAGIARALSDDEVGAVMCARGGYGVTRILGSIDPEPLLRSSKILVGFSDVSALLCWAQMRAGLTSIHGPVVTQLSTLADEDVDRLVDMMRGECPAPLTAEEGTVVHGGSVEGRLVVGNLEVLRSLVGTRYLPPMNGAIVALEEVGERPYRIDRALTHMLQSGAFRGVRGVVIGQLLRCEEPENGQIASPTAHDVVVERLQPLGIPIVTGFPFGHDSVRNAALPFGTMVRLDADNVTLTLL